MTELIKAEVPFRMRNRVIPRGMWDGRIDADTRAAGVNLEGLARDVIFLAVAYVHDDKIVEKPVIGYRVVLEGQTFEHNFQQGDQEADLKKLDATVTLRTEDAVLLFRITVGRNGDILLDYEEPKKA